ncbi:NAD(P)/FAD-dependent oxidoreductase [Pseudonocardia sp. RS010]|uniref:NAD(P)/FAD-dependent oxidoreductase n=1 Tax=Pseudonocardia sp. RS010 TaxID=3385979 RepID=UPI0039A0B3FD
MNALAKVVVLGGGYAGTLAANHLRTRADVDVTLVNPRPEFVERIRLHELAAGTRDVAGIDFGTILGEGVRLVVDEAIRIDAPARRVDLASGAALGYDYLVHAVGSTAPVPAAAYTVAGIEQARRLRAALAELPAGAPVTVAGGGPTGIETAAELAERGRAVTLVTGGTLAPTLSERGRRRVATTLAELGVTVLDDVVVEVGEDAVVLAGGVRPSAVTVWTAGFAVPQLAARSGLRTDELGRLLTDETLTSLDDDRVVAAGDAAAPSGRPLRMSCQTALPLGQHAARTVLSRLAGTEPGTLDPAYAGTCLSLGRRAGTIQVSRRDDTPTGLVIAGRTAARIKEAVCRGTVWSVRQGRAVTMKGGRRRAPETVA